MKHILLSLILLLSGSSLMKGAPVTVESNDSVTARDIFVNLPVDVLDLLDKSTRISMLHYFDADSVWKAPNAMEGLSELIAVRPDYLSLRITDVSTLQIKLLPYKTGKLVMTVYSIGKDPGGDSQVSFFNSALKEIPSKNFLPLPQLKNFVNIPKGSVTTMKEIQEMLPFYTTLFNSYPDTDELTAELSLDKDYIDIDDYNILKLFLRPKITYHWTGKNFKLQ